MTTNEEYFAKLWRTDHEVEIFSFYKDEDLFAWIQNHKGEKYSIYKATCLLDFS